MFIALMEDGSPVEVLAWADWSVIPVPDRPENAYIVMAKDHMGAYLKALRNEFI